MGETTVACGYAFLPGKSQCIYEELFSAIANKSQELGFDLDHKIINIDFELAVINAAKAIFGESVQIQGCFYHLTQNTWTKIQDLGLAQDYKDNDDIKLFCGMIDPLTFLPCDQVLEGMEYLQSVCPEELVDLVTYFNTNYVSGSFKKLQVPAAIGDDWVLI